MFCCYPFLFKVKKLTPRVVHAAKILFKDPDNEVNIKLVDCACDYFKQRMKYVIIMQCLQYISNIQCMCTCVYINVYLHILLE